MTCVLFAHRDAEYFAPKLREKFPALRVLTAPDLPEALAARCKAFAMGAVGDETKRVPDQPRAGWLVR
jgi:hypothetical protein